MISETLRDQVRKLKEEHRALDETISLLNETAERDQFAIQRLKKKKLYLKDKILKLEMQIIPDIIA